MIPKLAMKQRFLMHLIFSVTALHIASSDAEQRPPILPRPVAYRDPRERHLLVCWSNADLCIFSQPGRLTTANRKPAMGSPRDLRYLRASARNTAGLRRLLGRSREE